MNVNFLILGCILIGTCGQLLLKVGMNQIGKVSLSADHLSQFILNIASNPYVIGGTSCYGLSLLLWLVVLSRAQVSYAYPLLALGYIVTAVTAHFFLGEPLGIYRLLGIILIISGTVFITRT